MKLWLLPYGLSRLTNRCFALAGIQLNRPAIILDLKSGKRYPSTGRRSMWMPA